MLDAFNRHGKGFEFLAFHSKCFKNVWVGLMALAIVCAVLAVVGVVEAAPEDYYIGKQVVLPLGVVLYINLADRESPAPKRATRW